MVHLSEHYADADIVAASDVTLEGSKTSFARCLKAILGAGYEEFEQERDDHMAQLLNGPAIASMIDRMGKFLRERSPIRLAPDLDAIVGERFDVSNPLPPARRIIHNFPPVEFCYDTARTKRDQYPWPGLEKFGPFSRPWFSKRSPFILLICPDDAQGPNGPLAARRWDIGRTFFTGSNYWIAARSNRRCWLEQITVHDMGIALQLVVAALLGARP
jgi:hypothetical protein